MNTQFQSLEYSSVLSVLSLVRHHIFFFLMFPLSSYFISLLQLSNLLFKSYI